MRFRPTLPSPSMAVAMTALFVALGGTGYAASELHSGRGDVRAAKKKTKVSNDNAQDLAYFNRHKNLFTGPRGPQGAQGPQGSQGPQGPHGPAGTALAYAHITSTGTFDSANSAGLTASNFTHAGPGTYCFKGLSFTPHNAVATLDNQGAPSSTPIVAVDLTSFAGAICGGTGVQLAVLTHNSSNTLTDYGVFILFN